MWRGDLYFLRCCCKAFLPHPEEGEDNEDAKDYYELLGVGRKASVEELRRAYKKRSLEFHPDKIAQRRGNGNFDEEASRRKFQRIKEAYEVLIAPKKRDMYDIMGKEAMPYLLNPSSIEYKIVYDNLAKASIVDRLKIVLGYFIIFFIFLIQPILICLKVDDQDGGAFDNTSWVVLLIPLWILDFFALLGLLSIALLVKNENAPSGANQLLSFLKLISVVLAQIFLALKFDGSISLTYAVIFIPIYVYEVVRVIQSSWIVSSNNKEISRMVTMTYIEKEHGKGYADMSPEERDEMNEKYIIVHTPPVPPDMDEALKELVDNLDIYESPEYQQVQQLSQKALGDILTAVMHSIFLGLLVPNLDKDEVNWNWWIVFIPFWVSFCFQCTRSCYILMCTGDASESEENEEENEVEIDEEQNKTIDFTGDKNKTSLKEDENRKEVTGIENENNEEGVPSSQTDPQSFPFSEEETRKKMKDVEIILDTVESTMEQQTQDNGVEIEDDGEEYEEFEEESSSSIEATTQAIASCCLVLFYLTIVCIFVGKLQAGEKSYSAFWVIFPLLLPAGIMLCCMSLGILTFHGMDSFFQKSDDDDDSNNEGISVGQDNDLERGFSDRLSPSDIDKVSVRSMTDLSLNDEKIAPSPPTSPEKEVECEMDELD